MNQRWVDCGWKSRNVRWRGGGADEEEEEGRRWRGSSWGIESVSMLIALIWRGWWTEDSTSALIQAHFPRSQLLDSQLSPPKIPERHRLKLWGYDSAFCCYFTAFYLHLMCASCTKGWFLEWSDIKNCLILENKLRQGYLSFYEWNSTYQSGERLCCYWKCRLYCIIGGIPGETHG